MREFSEVYIVPGVDPFLIVHIVIIIICTHNNDHDYLKLVILTETGSLLSQHTEFHTFVTSFVTACMNVLDPALLIIFALNL